MRLIFYSLIVLNIVYFGYKMLGIGEVQDVEVVESVGYNDAKPLVLVSERPDLVAPRADTAQGTRRATPICAAIGPFADQAQGDDALSQLQAEGYQPVLRQIEVEDPISWVYIPRFANKKAAHKRLAELNAQEIDSFLVTDAGPYKYSISLGYFKNTESAQSLVKRLNASGINAQLASRVREKEELWINIPVSTLEGQSSDFLQQYLQDHEALREERIEC